MFNISTKLGDSGETSLFNGERVGKSSTFIHAVGELDELQAVLGMVKCCVGECGNEGCFCDGEEESRGGGKESHSCKEEEDGDGCCGCGRACCEGKRRGDGASVESCGGDEKPCNYENFSFFEMIESVQKDLYRAMAAVGNRFVPMESVDFISEDDVLRLEIWMKNILDGKCAGINQMYGVKVESGDGGEGCGDNSFVLPGEGELSARLHLARTVCRRAERWLVECFCDSQKTVYFDLLKYLNRLSDLLFVMAKNSES